MREEVRGCCFSPAELASCTRAFRERDALLVWLKIDPAFEVIRSDPRYAAPFKASAFPPERGR